MMFTAMQSTNPGVKENRRLIPPHRHSPPEDAYPTNIASYPAFTVNEFERPWCSSPETRRGSLSLGFPHMGNFMADLLRMF